VQIKIQGEFQAIEILTQSLITAAKNKQLGLKLPTAKIKIECSCNQYNIHTFRGGRKTGTNTKTTK
jgi:hypothetical protein